MNYSILTDREAWTCQIVDKKLNSLKLTMFFQFEIFL